MTEVTIIINGDTTDIDTDLARFQGVEGLFRPGQGVIDFQHPELIFRLKKARMLAKETPCEKNCYDIGLTGIPSKPGVIMKVQLSTSMGTILLELEPGKAPKTVANFVAYARSGHYEGTIFHRVIEDFMIQGGGLDADMKTRPASSTVENEADNGLPNLDGTIAMARTSDPHSASSQFFINTTDNAFLNHQSKTDDGWGYCVFGRVIDGMDVVGKIEETPTTTRAGYQDVPAQTILIESVTVLDD